MIAQSPDDAVAPLRDDDVPQAGRSVATGRRPTHGQPKHERVDENEGQVHRSLYAKLATIDLIRSIAHDQRVSAQSLYREGLLLMLQSRGYYKDKTLEDV